MYTKGLFLLDKWDAASQNLPNMLMLGDAAMQELGCFQLLGFVYRSFNMLLHEVMFVDDWGPQDLVVVSSI